MQVGIEEVGFSLLWALGFILCCFSGCYWKDKARFILVAGLLVAMPLYGCAAVQETTVKSRKQIEKFFILRRGTGKS